MSELTKEQEQQRYLLKRAVQYMDGDTDSGEHHDALNALYASLAAKERELQDAEREIDVRFEHWSPPEIVEGLKQQLQEAQQQFGEVQLRVQRLEDEARRTKHWLEDAKIEAGADINESFDIVWQRTLKKTRELERDLETARGFIDDIDERSIQELKDSRKTGGFAGDPYDAPDDCDTHIIVTRGEIRKMRKALATLSGEKSGGQS